MSVLNDYFHTSLAKVVQASVIIKPKVISHRSYMVILDSNGVATIMHTGNSPIIVTRTIKNIHNIFSGEIDTGDVGFQEVYFLDNVGRTASILEAEYNEPSWETDSSRDIIHISTGIDIDIYTNVRGEVEISDSDHTLTEINFPEPVVATVATNYSILFLTVSGVVRVYETLAEHDMLSFSEFNEEFWNGIPDKPKMEDIVINNLSKDLIYYDVMKISASNIMSYVLRINRRTNRLDDDNDVSLDDDGEVLTSFASELVREATVDISTSITESTLMLLSNGRVKNDGVIIPYVSDIIAISSGDPSALIKADGRVLIANDDNINFTAIPRFRLTL